MKCEKYTKEDKSEGEVYKLEAGDKVQFQRTHVRQSKFGQQTAVITECGKYVNLTNGQAKVLTDKNVQEGDTIEAYAYKNDYGDQIGINVIHRDKVPSTQTPLPADMFPKAVADNWVAFAKEYQESMKDTGNSMHMLGAYVANHHQEQFSDVITLIKKQFEVK